MTAEEKCEICKEAEAKHKLDDTKVCDECFDEAIAEARLETNNH